MIKENYSYSQKLTELSSDVDNFKKNTKNLEDQLTEKEHEIVRLRDLHTEYKHFEKHCEIMERMLQKVRFEC